MYQKKVSLQCVHEYFIERMAYLPVSFDFNYFKVQMKLKKKTPIVK